MRALLRNMGTHAIGALAVALLVLGLAGCESFSSPSKRIDYKSTATGPALELPPDLPVGAPLRDILTLQAARGDFGRDDPSAEVAKRLEWFYRDVPTTKERVTPRGRILQISRRAMKLRNTAASFGSCRESSLMATLRLSCGS